MDSERCTYPGCGNLYEMQTPDSLTRPENPNPKWPVPKDLIELQPSYKQAGLANHCCLQFFMANNFTDTYYLLFYPG